MQSARRHEQFYDYRLPSTVSRLNGYTVEQGVMRNVNAFNAKLFGALDLYLQSRPGTREAVSLIKGIRKNASKPRT